MADTTEKKDDLTKLSEVMRKAVDKLETIMEGNGYNGDQQLEAAKFVLQNGGDIAKRFKSVKETGSSW